MAEAPWRATTVPDLQAGGRPGTALPGQVMFRDRTGRQSVRHFDRFEHAKRFKATVTGKRPHDVAAPSRSSTRPKVPRATMRKKR
jgi:hypothetical protein